MEFSDKFYHPVNIGKNLDECERVTGTQWFDPELRYLHRTKPDM